MSSRDQRKSNNNIERNNESSRPVKEEKPVPSAYEYLASWWPVAGAGEKPSPKEESRGKRDISAPGREHSERSEEQYGKDVLHGHDERELGGGPQAPHSYYPQGGQHYYGQPPQHYDPRYYPQQHYDPRYPQQQQYHDQQYHQQYPPQQYPQEYYPHPQQHGQHYPPQGNPYSKDMDARIAAEYAQEDGSSEDVHDPRCRDAYSKGDNDRENEGAYGQQRYYPGMQYYPAGSAHAQEPRRTQEKQPKEIPQTADNNPFIAASEIFSALKRDLFGGPTVVKKTVVYEQSIQRDSRQGGGKLDLHKEPGGVAPEGTTFAVKGTIAPEEGVRASEAEEGRQPLPRASGGSETAWVTKRARVTNQIPEHLKSAANSDAAPREVAKKDAPKKNNQSKKQQEKSVPAASQERKFAPAPKDEQRPIFKGSGQEMGYLGYVSAKNGKLNDLLYTLDCGLDPETVDSDKKTLLMWAARMGHLDIIRLLIERGADVGRKTTEEMHTALFWACRFGQTRCAEELIRSGADVNQVDHKQHTPLMYCAANGYVALARLLLEGGADPNAAARAPSGKSLNQMKNIDRHFMLGQNVRENLDWEEFSDGKTAIQVAARHDSHLVVALLVEFGADVNGRDDRGRSAVYWASFFGLIETLHVLAEYARADLNIPDAEGNSPLMWAVRQEQKEAVKFLLYHGAYLNYSAPNEPSRTPRNWALQHSDREMVAILDEFQARSAQPRGGLASYLPQGWY